MNQVEQGHAKKIIILLPTMVTSNSIHDRLRDFFEKEHGHKVGLVHSTADLVRESETEGDEADRADVRSDLLSESHYFRPVTVGTVDQLLVPLFHAGRWAMKTFAAADAAIVIDEIHAYEPHTLGLITLMIEQLAALGTRFMVMSATMPEDLKTVLRDALISRASTDVTAVEDDELLDSARNTWTTCDKTLSECLLSLDVQGRTLPSPEFLDLWGSRNDRGEPLKILIVVNTVKRCQELSKALREFGFELICYHSKFIFERPPREGATDQRMPAATADRHAGRRGLPGHRLRHPPDRVRPDRCPRPASRAGQPRPSRDQRPRRGPPPREGERKRLRVPAGRPRHHLELCSSRSRSRRNAT